MLVDDPRIALDMGVLMTEAHKIEFDTYDRDMYEAYLERLWWYYIGVPVLGLDPRTGKKADYINGRKTS